MPHELESLSIPTFLSSPECSAPAFVSGCTATHRSVAVSSQGKKEAMRLKILTNYPVILPWST